MLALHFWNLIKMNELKISKPYKKENLEKVIKNIPDLIDKNQKIIEKLYQLKLSCMNELNKISDVFYLARKTKKEIKPLMFEYIKDHKLAFDKNPNWYESTSIGYSMENFWINQRTTWNKAHNLKWNNNRDLNGRLME